MRARRFALFRNLAAQLPKPISIIDIGGTTSFWEQHGWADREDVEITLVNQKAEERKHANIIPEAGDATDLKDHAESSFDIAFSNSVIEHLFALDNQRAMAAEVLRVGRAYWVQTPNFWFPIEPHFHMLGWQWMPEFLRIWTIRRRACGWRGPCPDPEEARNAVREVRLLTRRKLQKLFPEGKIISERYCGLVKSMIVVGGFPNGVPLSL